MVGMRTVKLFSLPMAAEVEEVLLLLTSLAMVAAEEALAAQEDVAKLGFGPTDERINTKKSSRTTRAGRTEDRLPAVHFVCHIYEAR